MNRMKLLSYWEDRSSRAEQEIGKSAPKFEMDAHKKRMLYNNLRPKAQRLVGISNVPEEHERKTFLQYYTLLGHVFEPPAESEQMKLEFEARIQQQGGPVAAFIFRDKESDEVHYSTNIRYLIQNQIK